MERNADAALALSIIVLLVQVMMLIFLYQARQKVRALHRSTDVERGLEPKDTSRGMPTQATSRHLAQDPPLTSPAPVRSCDPVGHSPADALGRPVAAYDSQEESHGEADDYYNPSPISRRPTYAVGSGIGQQTHGTDYTKARRHSRHGGGGPPTNSNDADYGRKGNRFAHGT